MLADSQILRFQDEVLAMRLCIVYRLEFAH